MAFNQNVYDFVLANIENPFAIAAAMADFGISTSQLADAIGLDTSVVNSFFDNAGVAVVDDTGSGFDDTQSVTEQPVYIEPEQDSVVTVEPQQVTSTTPVQPQLNISDEVKNIKDAWFSSTGTQAPMSDKEIETFIRNNPETYNLSLLNVIDQYEKDKDSEKIRSELLSAQETGNQLTTREVLDIAAKSNLSLEDFVTKYFGNNSETLATLQAESDFTPQERSWRETAQNLKDLTFQQVLDFQTANKLSDKDMNRIFGIKESDLNTYRLQAALPSYAGEDKQLSYGEIIDFAKDKNISLSDAVGLIATKETQSELLSKVEAYNQKTPTERLADQLRGYIDPSSKGGAWTTQSGKSSGPGFGTEGMLNQLGQRLQSATGIEDINQLGLRTIDKPKEFALHPTYGGYYTDPYDGTTYPVGPQIGWHYVTTGTDSYGNQYAEAKPITLEDVKNIYTNEDGQTRGTVPVPVTEVYNKATGQSIREGASIDLGGWGEGDGTTYANLTFDANGKPKVSTWGNDSSDEGTILSIVSFGLMAVPVIGQAVGASILGPTASAATATALGNAVINAGIQIATGVEPIKAIGGAAASMFGATVSPYVTALIDESINNPQVSNIITKAIEGGVKGVLTDQDVGLSALSSLTGQALGGITQQMIDDPALARQIASAVSMGTSAAVAGLDVPTAVMSGLIQGSRDTTTKPAPVTTGTAVGGEASTGGVNLSDDLPGDILNPISPSDEEIISAGRKLSGSATDAVDLVLNDPALQLAIQDAIDADNRSIVQNTFAKYPDVPFTQEQVEAWVQWAKQNPDMDLAQEIDKGFRANAAATTTSGGVQTSTTNVATDAQQDLDAKTVLPGGRLEITAPSDTAPIDLTPGGRLEITAPSDTAPIDLTQPLLPTGTSGGTTLATPATGGPLVITAKKENELLPTNSLIITAKKDDQELLPTNSLIITAKKDDQELLPTNSLTVTAKKEDELLPTNSLTVTGTKDDLLPTDAEIIDLIAKETIAPGLLPTLLAPTKPETVRPGTRVQEDPSLLPLRPGLSEGYTGDIEGTPEEEQQPVWNVRSLKLRRALGI